MDGAMAALHFGIVGRMPGTNHSMTDTQACQPEGKGAGEGVLTGTDQGRLAVGLDFIGQRPPARCTQAQGGAGLFEGYALRELMNLSMSKQAHYQTRFTHRVTHRMHTHQGPILKLDVGFEVELPLLVHLCRGIRPLARRRLPLARPPKARPLMEIASNLDFVGQLQAAQRAAVAYMEAQAVTPPAGVR